MIGETLIHCWPVGQKARGIQACVVLLPDATNSSVVANVHLDFEKARTSSLSDQGLEKAIWERHTNTLMFENRSLSNLESDALAASINDNSGIGLHILTKDEDKEKVFTAAALAEQIRFSRRDLHEQLHRMIRWTDARPMRIKAVILYPVWAYVDLVKLSFA